MLLAEDRATGVGGVGEDQAGGFLINKTLQMLQVHFPGPLGLQRQQDIPTKVLHLFLFDDVIMLGDRDQLRVRDRYLQVGC